MLEQLLLFFFIICAAVGLGLLIAKVLSRPQAQTETALRKAHDKLEQRFQEQSADLTTVTQALKARVMERKQAEARLQEVLSLQQAILDSANYMIISTTIDGTITTFNRAAERYLGYDAEEVIGKTSPVLIHDPAEVIARSQELSEELNTAIAPGFEALVAKTRLGEPDEREWTYIRKDGTRFPILLSVTALRNTENQITGFLGIGSDITKRKQDECELRTMSKVLESAVEGISHLDSQGHYIRVNPAYANMVGYEPAELLGIDWQLTVHPDDRAKMVAAYQHMLDQGKVEVEARAVRKDGSVFDKQVTMITAFDEQQQSIGHYCFMKDISERRDIERLKDEFISVVSHELRTPLTSISAALDLLAGGVLQNQPDEAQRMLNIAANNTDRLVRLINDILDIERIESGKVTMTKESCNVAELMTRSIESIQEMADQAEIRLEVEPIEVQVWADSDRIIQVLTNLLSNAIKFSPAGSTVSLTAETKEYEPSLFTLQSASYVLFKLRDQGRGIPAEKLESIFERFQQVDASDSRQRGGTGLGLAICRSILQQHGGQIWASSTLGVGSTFWFTLPMTNAPASAPACDIAQFAPPLILECDDDPSVRTVIQALLERQGYRVVSVGSGLEAVQQASLVHPAAILLNLVMPEMDGWATLAALKQQPDTQSIPVIILSGVLPSAQDPHPEVSDWIVKPPEPRRLYQALERALTKPERTLRVLIVEDDRDLAQVLSTLFTRHGIATYCAQTGREALQLSQQIMPDLLVLDLGLPECDGFVVVDWLQKHNRLCSVPLVVYTALDLNGEERDRLRLGETLILTKGRISPQEFEQRVIHLLNRIVQAKQGG